MSDGDTEEGLDAPDFWRSVSARNAQRLVNALPYRRVRNVDSAAAVDARRAAAQRQNVAEFC